MTQSKFFTPTQIAGSNGANAAAVKTAWQITGTAGENAYLLEGEKSALLIDTLTGAGTLKAFCRELTDLPVTVAITHGHVDHAGGVYDFGDCFIHPEDIPHMYTDGNVQRRKGFIDARSGASSVQERDFTPPSPVWTFPIYDGSVFDLGDRRVEAVGVPGHTRGSLVFIDANTRIAFLGDAVNTNTLLYLKDSTGIPEYKQGLLHFKDRLKGVNEVKETGPVNTFWSGHGKKPLPLAIVDEALSLCDRILAGTDDAEEVSGKGPNPVYYARRRDTCTEVSANIGYLKEWIQKAPVPLLPPLVC
jgi:glyoxylase-like metal-dependent hydrolase (beta-lactamase superfamily II)